MYTCQYTIHNGITNKNLDESMYIGRACMDISRASMNTVHDSIHIGRVYILVLMQTWPVYILVCQFEKFINWQTSIYNDRVCVLVLAYLIWISFVPLYHKCTTVLNCTMPWHTVRYCTLQNHSKPYRTIPDGIVWYQSVPYCTIA